MIDIFSRYLWLRPLKDKTAKNVLNAFKSIFDGGVKFLKIRTDGGKEFSNRFLQQYLKGKNIYHYITLNEKQANYAERVIRTLKGMSTNQSITLSNKIDFIFYHKEYKY